MAFDKIDPWQTKVAELARNNPNVCSFMIHMKSGRVHEVHQGICHADAYPNSWVHGNKKWEPVSVTTDLRRSKEYADWYEFLLDEQISPYRNGPIKAAERIVGDDGYLRAVKLTNMECRTKTLLNFLVMTRMPWEYPGVVNLWRRFVAAGVNKHAAMMAAHLFSQKDSVRLELNRYLAGHQAMNYDTAGDWQPSVKRLMEANPKDDSPAYTDNNYHDRGLSAIWDSVGWNDDKRIQVSATVTNKVVVQVYTGSFKKMFVNIDGDKTFNLAKPAEHRNDPVFYKFEDVVASIDKWGTL